MFDLYVSHCHLSGELGKNPFLTYPLDNRDYIYEFVSASESIIHNASQGSTYTVTLCRRSGYKMQVIVLHMLCENDIKASGIWKRFK